MKLGICGTIVTRLIGYQKLQRSEENRDLSMLAVPDAAFMEELTAHVNMLIKDNRSIDAIRMVHDQLGWKLIDAKIFVDKRREELAKAGEI